MCVFRSLSRYNAEYITIIIINGTEGRMRGETRGERLHTKLSVLCMNIIHTDIEHYVRR